jgi:hypothetical protein
VNVDTAVFQALRERAAEIGKLAEDVTELRCL